MHKLLKLLSCEIEPFTVSHARTAHQGWKRFGKGRHEAGVNLGDCCAYGLAESSGASLLFKGEDFSKTDIAAVLS
ncbi:type II toxin-antitoxin system VapC family toxin [Nesterenkonia sp.]|uniref:type II toxin-antitoxin system VapC family toxin n=1 Tax=Nesterenkonia sp. TaxID=704201 RepID=UPI002620BF8F|nr:type II toxin-antitoxin system VapC family toxin [Nesterenkonia sp.]